MCSKPLFLGRDRIPKDLVQGVMGWEGLISEEEVLEALVKLGLDLVAQGFSLRDLGSRLSVVVENVFPAGPHGRWPRAALPGKFPMTVCGTRS